MIKPKAILEALVTAVTANCELVTRLDPDPLTYSGVVLHINPRDWEPEPELGYTRILLRLQGTLTASGDGPGLFLDDAMEAHLRLVLWLDSDPLITVGGLSLQVKGQAIPGPALIANQDEGKKPFDYEKSFDLVVAVPKTAFNKE